MTLPQELSVFSHLRFITRRSPYEWSAECPNCGDYGHVGNDKPDRFRMFTSSKPGSGGAAGWCRSCGYYQWADKDPRRLSPEEVARMHQQQAVLAERERKRVKKLVDRLMEEREWEIYYKLQTEESHAIWEQHGIPADMQDWWRLGYNPQLTYVFGDEVKMSPALTIPYFRDKDTVVNIQSRIIEPVGTGDKYRFKPNLPVPMFDPDMGGVSHVGAKVLIGEGAKKVMVGWRHLGARYKMYALPCKNMAYKHVGLLKGASEIIFALDPDANDEAFANGEKVIEAMPDMRGRVKVASLPDKLDDLFLAGADRNQIDTYIKLARPV